MILIPSAKSQQDGCKLGLEFSVMVIAHGSRHLNRVTLTFDYFKVGDLRLSSECG